ncbi:MAG: 30S ribosomal protein S5 [Treponema sp.]|nr:30S ribosomal protein S5 [Treponema sp.]
MIDDRTEDTEDKDVEIDADVDAVEVSAEDSRSSRGRGGRGRGRDRDRGDREPVEKEFVEKLVKLNRTAKVVKGGRRFSFSALTVIGDRKGKVGYGFGKANDVSEAIRKSIDKAKRSMIQLPVKNGTIPHEVKGFFKSSYVLLKPARSGTGIIAGGPVRAIMEAGGVTDVLSKSIGSSSQYNVVKATFDCISKMMDPRTISRNRGKSLNELWG